MIREYLDAVKKKIKDEQAKPLSAAIFGQTGCGKSSLTNAIFGTLFDVDDVKPCTKEPQSHHSIDRDGNPITFWDLPGIGESQEADSRYLDMYADCASKCDVVLWAFQADTRAMTLDVTALETIISRLDVKRRADFLSRLTVIITKADVVTTGPWIFSRSKEGVHVAASSEVEVTLEQKASYFFDGLLGAYKEQLVHRTYVSSKQQALVSLPSDFTLDKRGAFLFHRGALDSTKYRKLAVQNPDVQDELKRLHQQSQAVYCSARLRFNLNEVKAQIAQKGSGNSMLRLHQSVERTTSLLQWDYLKKLGFPIIWDAEREEAIFNVASY